MVGGPTGVRRLRGVESPGSMDERALEEEIRKMNTKLDAKLASIGSGTKLASTTVGKTAASVVPASAQRTGKRAVSSAASGGPRGATPKRQNLVATTASATSVRSTTPRATTPRATTPRSKMTYRETDAERAAEIAAQIIKLAANARGLVSIDDLQAHFGPSHKQYGRFFKWVVSDRASSFRRFDGDDLVPYDLASLQQAVVAFLSDERSDAYRGSKFVKARSGGGGGAPAVSHSPSAARTGVADRGNSEALPLDVPHLPCLDLIPFDAWEAEGIFAKVIVDLEIPCNPLPVVKASWPKYDFSTVLGRFAESSDAFLTMPKMAPWRPTTANE
eukprot:TRINITY_DN43734_c0_g1_i1.p1 TRINITY_DN43734_c0_g1~~TRINITY_DN43734_c0_g1_i1.p1  ORF type:complete len:379 (+),score=47.25 TRINITY_DN43734_c0_g1_i1:143-1138(+)